MGMTADSLFDSGNGMRAAWGMLVAEWALMLVLAWYLEQVCGGYFIGRTSATLATLHGCQISIIRAAAAELQPAT
jgi:hypothetical protein